MRKAFKGKLIGMILLFALFMVATDDRIAKNIGCLGTNRANSALAADNRMRFDIKRLLPIILELSSVPAYKASVGYDSEGNISVWIDLDDDLTDEEIKEYQLSYPQVSYYHLWVGKKLFTIFPEIHSLWLNSADDVSDAAIHITRNTFIRSGLADLPTDKEGFFTKVEKDLGKYTDEYWDSYCYEGENGFDWSYTRNHMDRLFGKRLKAFIPGEHGVNLKIYGLSGGPENMKALNEEIAKAFALSIGRYESQYWYCIYWCQLSYYQTDGKKLFDIYIWQDDFQKWYKDGFDYNQWPKYCEVTKYDKKLNFVVNEKPKPTVKPYPDKKPSYGEVLKFIQGLPKVKMLLLGQGAKGLDAFLGMDEQEPGVLNRREMEISMQLMEMGLNSVRFISRNGSKKRIIYLDRERYQILMLFNPEKKYDFPPDLWPIMAKEFWEVD